MMWPLRLAAADMPDPEAYRNQCLQGMTIYCISLGMQEYKSGNTEKAMEYYRLACQNHPTRGHLRACTPYLGLARELGRLDSASAGLESRCRAGNPVVCFYLAKEYLNLTEYHRAYGHLERLCREGFIPPDKADFGPCYHLGNSLEKIGEMGRAAQIFKFDCDQHPGGRVPSCFRFVTVKGRLGRGEGVVTAFPKKLKPVDGALFLLVLMPLLGLLLFYRGGSIACMLLRIPIPIVTLGCWGIWEWHAPRYFPGRVDLYFILPAVVLVLLMAGLAATRPGKTHLSGGPAAR